VSAAHTPGPWVYRPHDFDDWGIVRVTADESRYGFVICQARNPEVTGEQLGAYRESGVDPYEANARLIAAAPALLEALEELLKIRSGRTAKMARAAIAAAKGDA